jgi:hypothetical protein
MGGGQPQVVTTNTAPWKGQQKYLLKGFDMAEKMFNDVPDYYPGETVAGFDPLQTMAQEGAANYITGKRAGRQQQYAEQNLLQGLSGGIDTSAYNPMVDALTSNVLSNLQRNILPGLRSQAIQYGGPTSRDALQSNRAISDAVSSGLTKPLAEMYTNAYNQAQQRAVQTAGLYPSIMAAPLSMYGALGDIGAQRRAMTQATMDADMARYQYQATAPQQALSNYMNAIQGNYGGQSYQTSPGPSALDQASQILGLAGSAAMLAGGIPPVGSDRRIKNNIVPEGSKWKGLNVYSFNYIGDDTPRRGVMAQEAEVLYPHAVHEVGGIKFVDYGAI